MKLKRGMIIDVNLDPTLGSETDKIRELENDLMIEIDQCLKIVFALL
jgi:hypothetical protein